MTTSTPGAHRTGRLRRLPELYDLEGDELAVAVRGRQQGGAIGLDVLERPWSPTAADKARARSALEDPDGSEPLPLRLWRNRCWWPEGPAERDPAAALAGLHEGTTRPS